MKQYQPVLLFLFVIIFLVSCKKDNNNTIPVKGDYLPLQVQNYWDFEHSERLSVSGTKTINDKLYYILVQGIDTNYYRNVDNKILVRSAWGDEDIMYDLTADLKSKWYYNSWEITMASKTDTVILNNTKIPGCYCFSFNIPDAVDDEYSVWLAPGIGFVKRTCGFCPFPGMYLTKARINNVVITFP